MICTTLQHKSYEEILSILDDPWVELAEIRLDRCVLSDEEIEDLFGNSDVPLVATCRIAEAGAEEAERLLSLAVRSGARLADLEIEAWKIASSGNTPWLNADPSREMPERIAQILAVTGK